MSDYSFFFQAEDGIRDTSVTGVQTCALPISCDLVLIALKATNNEALLQLIPALLHQRTILLTLQNGLGNEDRSEERRVGKECRSGRAPYHCKKKEQVKITQMTLQDIRCCLRS